MPLYGLQLSCELENLTGLRLKEGYVWHISATCTACGASHPDLYIDEAEKFEVPGSRGKAHCVVTCSDCKRTNTIVLESQVSKAFYNADDTGFVTVGKMTARGLEIRAWILGEGFEVDGADGSSSTFDVDLSDDFYDYDEAKEVEVSIQEISTYITPLKKKS